MNLLADYGTPILFGIVFIEQLGVPIPAAPLLLTAGGLVGVGQFKLLPTVLFPLLGCVLADWIWYEMGRRQGFKILQRLCQLSMNPNVCVRRTENTFAKYGVKTLLGAKFVPGLNTLSPPLAGMFNIRLGRFLVYDTAGACLYLGLYLLLGILFHHQIATLLQHLERLGHGAVWVVAAIVSVFVLYKILYREWVLHSLRMARIKPEELYSSLNVNPKNYFVLDLRSHLDLKELPFKIPGAVHMLPEEIEMRHPEIPRDRDVVVYCACPNETSSSKMALRLRKKGILKIRPLLGGIVGWRYQEFPVEEFSL